MARRLSLVALPPTRRPWACLFPPNAHFSLPAVMPLAQGPQTDARCVWLHIVRGAPAPRPHWPDTDSGAAFLAQNRGMLAAQQAPLRQRPWGKAGNPPKCSGTPTSTG